MNTTLLRQAIGNYDFGIPVTFSEQSGTLTVQRGAASCTYQEVPSGLKMMHGPTFNRREVLRGLPLLPVLSPVQALPVLAQFGLNLPEGVQVTATSLGRDEHDNTQLLRLTAAGSDTQTFLLASQTVLGSNAEGNLRLARRLEYRSALADTAALLSHEHLYFQDWKDLKAGRLERAQHYGQCISQDEFENLVYFQELPEQPIDGQQHREYPINRWAIQSDTTYFSSVINYFFG